LRELLEEIDWANEVVVQGPGGGINIAPLLPDIELVTRRPQPKDVVVAVTGAPPFVGLSNFVKEVGKYPVDVRIVLLVAGEPHEFLSPDVFKALAKAELELCAASVLVYPDIRLAICLRRVKAKKASSATELLALVNVLCAPGLALALAESELENQELLRAFGSEIAVARLKDANAALERELDVTKARMHAGLSRLEHLERSATWRVGDVVVGVGRSPGKALQAVPKLVRIWRNRRDVGRQRDVSALIGVVTGEQMLGNYQIEGAKNRLLIGLVGASADATKLAETFAVVRLGPHDLVAKLEAARPSLLLITSTASSPDEPWCYLATPSGLDKERSLLGGLQRAKGLGIPSIFIGVGHLSGDWRATQVRVDLSFETSTAAKLPELVTKTIKRLELA
jgi:hypothetical protein